MMCRLLEEGIRLLGESIRVNGRVRKDASGGDVLS